MEENKTQTPAAGESKGTSLTPNVMAALSYVLGALSGVVVLLLEKDNKFVKFHAMQSIAFHLLSIVISFGVGYVPVLGVIAGMVWGLGSFVLWLFLIYKAYNNEEFEIPVLGKLVRDNFLNK